ncbi:hypothetical protein A3K55_00410 [Candidatus Shapirobacteria bacterium RBG_13_44_7]|uniref:Uncharacterized protein n=1 Tax=Candidatus Shapirobacteria bacterium RBG_13_44_7 TaxID=1802149 RepID=A0A1F7SIA0_9BACT|nr:MAG: hypothetical protein A3K55_00410 [Candidatus Shapirobacteria bacterium RBG_13_44_7]
MKNIATGTTIPDTNCDDPGDTCSYTVADTWSTDVGTSRSEWGYTLQNTNIGTSIFNYQAGYKAFGVGFAQAQTIISNTSTPSTIEIAYVCYRLTASNYQEAGNYENHLVYTATATF